MLRTKRAKGVKRKPTRRRSTPSWAITLADVAREYIWLWDKRHGMSAQTIATRAGVSVRRVQFGLARARAMEKGHEQYGESGVGGAGESALRGPRLIPMFPIGSYTPQSNCAHHRAIRSGSLFCCMVCHRSGIDEHPALHRDPRTDPAPEPKPAPSPSSAKQPARENRKQRRARQFAHLVPCNTARELN
jgi:hypothetical protein